MADFMPPEPPSSIGALLWWMVGALVGAVMFLTLWVRTLIGRIFQMQTETNEVMRASAVNAEKQAAAMEAVAQEAREARRDAKR
jgi:hypothetical protein